MQATVLLYNIQDKVRKDQIKKLLSAHGLEIKEIPKEEYLRPIGVHAGVKGVMPFGGAYEGEDLNGEMMVFAGLSGAQIDAVLAGFRLKEIEKVNCKAVLTPTNQFWNSIQLFKELQREHEAFGGNKG